VPAVASANANLTLGVPNNPVSAFIVSTPPALAAASAAALAATIALRSWEYPTPNVGSGKGEGTPGDNEETPLLFEGT